MPFRAFDDSDALCPQRKIDLRSVLMPFRAFDDSDKGSAALSNGRSFGLNALPGIR